ncbi:MAG: hypothetical protein HY303_13030 [Candidatus Wallbacteria bacterium]|nr:hypothetical protein [Candidatus Wallbacteria bacterium]
MVTMHLILVAMWGAVVLCEMVLERVGRRGPDWNHMVAELHYRIDLLIEAPILAGVALSGSWLAYSVGVSPARALKYVSGGLAILANVVCVGLVVARRRGADTSAAIFACGAIGIPLALVAAGLGLQLTR